MPTVPNERLKVYVRPISDIGRLELQDAHMTWHDFAPQSPLRMESTPVDPLGAHG